MVSVFFVIWILRRERGREGEKEVQRQREFESNQLRLNREMLLYKREWVEREEG